MSSKLLAIGGAAVGLYGVGVGLQAHVKQPSSQAEANREGSLGRLGVNIGRDIAISAADDFTVIPILEALKRVPSLRGYAGMMSMAQKAFIVGGAGIGGAIAGHDFQNFVAARAYSAAHNDDLTLSQALIPDPRIGSIEGFRNKGIAGLQRRDMTGIGSPAAGGIFYRMWHNPFADTLNNAIANPGNAPAQDPRSKALGFSVFGSVLGGALGAPGGLARATMLGLAGGVLGGLYGIQSAHNPDAALNARALGDVALAAAPTMTMAGLLYGLTSARAGRFGGLAARALDRASRGMNWAGGQLARSDTANRALQPKVVGVFRRGGNWARNGLMSSGAMSHMQAQLYRFSASAPAVDDFVLNRAIPGATSLAAHTAVAPLRVAHSITSQGLTPLLSHRAANRWEQSLGIGHLITIVPHQVAVGATAAGIVNSRRGKNSTHTMPSNSAR